MLIIKINYEDSWREMVIEPCDLQFDLHLFLQTATAIGKTKSRDLFRPIAVAACKKKWRSNCMSKSSIVGILV